MNEHEPGTNSGSPERMARAASKFESWIQEGLSAARTEGREIDLMTARLIAHALGRATGRESALAGFGRTGDGGYEALRDEYLPIYGDPTTPPTIREWIDWLGTYLVERENRGSMRSYMNEHLPPQLHQLLVRTELDVGGEQFTVHVPADQPENAIGQLALTLNEMALRQNPALQAFLALPDVDACSSDLHESFEGNFISTFDSFEDATHGLLELDEWEKDISEYAVERGFVIDSLTPDYEALIQRANDAYDLIEWKDKVHAFYK